MMKNDGLSTRLANQKKPINRFDESKVMKVG